MLRTFNILEDLWDERQLKKVPILILVNKQDLPEAQGAEHVTDLFGLQHRRKNRRRHDYYVQPVCALSGYGSSFASFPPKLTCPAFYLGRG